MAVVRRLEAASMATPAARLHAIVDGQAVIDAAALSSSDGPLTDHSDGVESPEPKLRPCELYVCNLPRSCDIARLHEMFKPYGTVQSVEEQNQDALNTAPNIVVEGPYKAYVVNLPWSVTPEDLRAHFSRFGALVSTRLLYNRRKGKNRVYGFISYSTPGELDSALSSNGEDFFGRVMVVRKI